MEQNTEKVHKRRVRYKGKYPRKYEEKYKELNPEKYKETIAHVISKGNTCRYAYIYHGERDPGFPSDKAGRNRI